MNILCTFILLVAVVIGGKSDFSLQRPASSARIGELIKAYMEWERIGPPDCGASKMKDTWFLDGINGAKPVGRECRIPPATTLVFPIMYLQTALNANNPGECARAIASTKQDVETTLGVLTVTIDGQVLDQSAYWRNDTDECFPLANELSEQTQKRGWTLPVWDDSFVDGYWLALRFEKAGLHTIEIREQPKPVNGRERAPSVANYTFHIEG